jgi:MFS family permease
MLAVLKIRDYRLLWLGQAASFIGDQFHLIALPWLVLQLTGDPFQLGIVLALTGVPRAAFMLLGGTWADRYSPRTMMLLSDAVRFGLAAVLATAVLGGFVGMGMIYTLSLLFGAVSGLFIPAASAAVPRLLPDERLEGGNALLQGVGQVAQFAGPACAGILIASFSGRAMADEQVASTLGIGVALSVDALSFLVSAATLWFISAMPGTGAEVKAGASAVSGAFSYAWSRPVFRWTLILMALANFLVAGPLMVGIPVLADQRLPEGAAALGLILSAYGFGNLCGIVGGGTLGRPRPRVLGAIVVSVFIGFGLSMGGLAFISSTWTALPVAALVGTGNGYLAVAIMSLLQRLAPREMLGRVMSLVMFCLFGLIPLSQALSGAVVKASPEALFVAAGLGLGATALLAATRPEVWSLGREMGAGPTRPALGTGGGPATRGAIRRPAPARTMGVS